MQEILVILVVMAAISYLALRLYKHFFSSKSSCEVNCGCEPSSMSPVIEQLKNRE